MGKRTKSVLTCPACSSGLVLNEGMLGCSHGHRYPEIDGIFDLRPVDAAPPVLDLFSTPYGWLYDNGVKYRPLARLASRVLFRTNADRMYEMMDAGIRCEPGQVVLDVPAGGSPALKTAAGRMRGTYVGLDLSRSMLNRAAAVRREEGMAGVILAQADAMRMPLETSSVDRALCFNSLHVISDKAAVLREIKRVLKPRGELWGTALIGAVAELPRPVRELGPPVLFHPADPAELREAAKEAGFMTWKQTRVGLLLLFRGSAR